MTEARARWQVPGAPYRKRIQLGYPNLEVVESEPAGRALQQIKERGYVDKYRAAGQPIHLIGIEFSRESRTLVGFEVETL
ncbi:hypothetical protein THSYN_12350 [Candidatus Thiodictyon syntrophicum]|uniref:Uncharacterized protein n=1 Tax=Candidatus Thiodictyon syntrophicum TaxID=1166950 RepID=A0A2K8U7X7_9GAMM|nr:hypothetical protein THSYN_12350 [Candidatus Thiodictyon syntrophicum]